jgi:uncharacterized membrane protein YsdA (DUF1294 family)
MSSRPLHRSVNPFKFFFIIAILLTAACWFALLQYTSLGVASSYLIAAGAISFLFCAYDKSVAGSGSTRIPELVLLIWALIGGSAGLLVGMRLFRHKTKKASFQFFLIIVVVAQIGLAYYLSQHLR